MLRYSVKCPSNYRQGRRKQIESAQCKVRLSRHDTNFLNDVIVSHDHISLSHRSHRKISDLTHLLKLPRSRQKNKNLKNKNTVLPFRHHPHHPHHPRPLKLNCPSSSTHLPHYLTHLLAFCSISPCLTFGGEDTHPCTITIAECVPHRIIHHYAWCVSVPPTIGAGFLLQFQNLLDPIQFWEMGPMPIQ